MKQSLLFLFLVSLCFSQSIKLGTLAPEGTTFYDITQQVANGWKTASGNKINMKIYAGGIAGAEPDLIRKMKIGQLQAASLSATGLILIDPGFAMLQLPAMMSSTSELDYCMKEMYSILSERLKEKGYILLNYMDLGPLYFFTTKKVTTVEELMKLKLCTFATDRESKALWTKAGYNVTDLNQSDVLAALQTGLVEGFIHTPIFALSMQWFGIANHMVNVNYGYALATTVVKKETWDKIDTALQGKFMSIAQSVSSKAMPDIRQMDKKAISAMKQHGLQVFEPAPKDVASWLAPPQKVYPQVRGTLIPEVVFDKAMAARAAYRSGKPK
jgi:TRAP-type C4-dicarboxylate transport system substrate-binding protein